MSLANSNVSFSALQTEYGGSNPISLSEYYANGSYIPNDTQGPGGAVPTSGQIKMSQLAGTPKYAWITKVTDHLNTTSAVNKCTIDSSGNVISIAVCYNVSGTAYATILKQDSAGNKIWKRQFSGSSGDTFPSAITTDISGNILISGSSGHPTSGSGGYSFIAKYNSEGLKLWDRYFYTSGWYNHNFTGICTDSSANIYVSGWQQQTSGSAAHVAYVKYDSSGVLQWQKTSYLTSGSNSYAYGCASSSSNEVYITGMMGVNFFLHKINTTTGATIWEKYLINTDRATGLSCSVDSSGNIYCAGYVGTGPYGSYDVFVVKYNSSGTLQWQTAMGTTNSDSSIDIFAASDGYVYVSSTIGGTTYTDAVHAKLDSSGNFIWKRKLKGNTNNNDTFAGVKVDQSGNIFLVGSMTTQNLGGANLVEGVVCKLPATNYTYSGTQSGIFGNYTLSNSTASSGSSPSFTEPTPAITSSDAAGSNTVTTLTESYSVSSVETTYVSTPKYELVTAMPAAYGTAYTTGISLDWGQSGVFATSNVFTIGSAYNVSNNNKYDLVLSKYNNKKGVLTWQKKLRDTSYNTDGRDICVDSSDNIYIVGYSDKSQAGTTKSILIAKYNSAGIVQWQRYIDISSPGSGDGFGLSICTDGTNVYFTGSSAAGYSSMTYLNVMALSTSNGTLQWQKGLYTTLASGYIAMGNSISSDISNGMLYVGGYVRNGTTTATKTQGVILKYTATGTLQWQIGISLTGYDVSIDNVAYDAATDMIYSTGYASDGTTNYIFVTKHNSSGTIQWQVKFDSGFVSSGGISVAAGGVYVNYMSGSSSNSFDKMNVLKLSKTDGSILWQNKITSSKAASFGLNYGSISSSRRGVVDSNESEYNFVMTQTALVDSVQSSGPSYGFGKIKIGTNLTSSSVITTRQVNGFTSANDVTFTLSTGTATSTTSALTSSSTTWTTSTSTNAVTTATLNAVSTEVMQYVSYNGY